MKEEVKNSLLLYIMPVFLNPTHKHRNEVAEIRHCYVPQEIRTQYSIIGAMRTREFTVQHGNQICKSEC
jgi:hypothetical protein